MAGDVRIFPLKGTPDHVAAADASFAGDMVIAVASLFTYPKMRHIKDSIALGTARFPYVPGLLFFREGPLLIRALRGLDIAPDVVLFDGQGIAHPRGLGLAAHMGIVLNMPSIGCAKSRLVGQFREPGMTKGDWSYLYGNGQGSSPIGAVVRTKTRVKPVFVSPGHMTDIESSVRVVMQCAGRFRIPEPVRNADILSRRLKREIRDRE